MIHHGASADSADLTGSYGPGTDTEIDSGSGRAPGLLSTSMLDRSPVRSNPEDETDTWIGDRAIREVTQPVRLGWEPAVAHIERSTSTLAHSRHDEMRDRLANNI